MSSLPLNLGLLPTTSEHQSGEDFVGKVADLSLTDAPPPPPPPPPSNLLQHSKHRYPSIHIELVEEAQGYDVQFANFGCVQRRSRCWVCRDDPVSDDGPIYRFSTTTGCDETEEEFFFHKSCAELPMKIIVNAFHPDHLLELFPPSSLNCICDMCEEQIFGFRYRCPLCNFDLHITCAVPPSFEQTHDEGHDHSFILFKPSAFTCDACGIEEERKKVSYLCTTCQIQVHTYKRCSSSSYPLKLKQILHSHELLLTYLFQLDFDFSNKLCKICNKKLNKVSSAYYCSSCAYIAHVSCATSEKFKGEYELYQGFEPAGSFVETNEISCLGGERENLHPTELQQQQPLPFKHFSHPHSLILCNDEPESVELCYGCRSFISVPFYTCDKPCNFSLHKQCVELRGKIEHPLHKHPLTLNPKHEWGWDDLLRCQGCALLCRSFTYTCVVLNCDFSLCVRCSLFSDTLIHEGHKCARALHLLQDEDGDQTKCSACGLNCSANFMCEECNFNLDLRCASLPNVTMHECPKPNWGIRPIKLTYSSVEDESGEYYCDICEKRRGQNHWFYFCEACDYSNHPQCILDKALSLGNG